MNIGYSRKCDNVKALVWHRSFNSGIIFPLYASIDHLTLLSLLSPVSWSRNNADRDKTDVVVRPWWPIRKLELLSRTKHAWLLNPVAMVNQRRPRIRKNHAERSRAKGRLPFSQNFWNFWFGGKWNTFRRLVHWKIPSKSGKSKKVGLFSRLEFPNGSRSLYQFQVHDRAPRPTGV